MKKIKLFAMAFAAMLGLKVSAVPAFEVPSTTFTLPDVDETWKWKGITEKHYVAKGDTLIFAAEELYQSVKADAAGMPWMNQTKGGTSGKSWDAMGCFLGSTAWGASNVVTVKNDTEKFYVLRVKNCAGAQAIVASGSNGKRTIHISAYELTDGVAAATPYKDASWESTDFGVIAIDELDGAKEYAILMWNEGVGSKGASDGNSNWGEIALITAPEAGEKYVAHFESAHGTAPADTSVASIKLPELTADGFLHLGWTADQKVKVGEDSIAAGELLVNDVKVCLGQATNFTAVWTAAFTVSYYDGTNLLGFEQVISGNKPAEYAQYESKEHMTFVGWFNETGLVNITPADSVITSDANFYGQWSGEVAQSASINIEQLVLDNGKGYNIKDALTAANIGYADIDALDSLNDTKDSRNEPYLGLKIKKQGGYIEMGLKKGDVLRVKFGNVAADLALTINGVESTLAKGDATTYEYTATEDCWVKIATTTSGTVVFKQIMMNENIKDVILPDSPQPTALSNAAIKAKAQKFMVNGAVYFRHNAKVFNMMGQEIRF